LCHVITSYYIRQSEYYSPSPYSPSPEPTLILLGGEVIHHTASAEAWNGYIPLFSWKTTHVLVVQHVYLQQVYLRLLSSP